MHRDNKYDNTWHARCLAILYLFYKKVYHSDEQDLLIKHIFTVWFFQIGLYIYLNVTFKKYQITVLYQFQYIDTTGMVS